MGVLVTVLGILLGSMQLHTLIPMHRQPETTGGGYPTVEVWCTQPESEGDPRCTTGEGE